MYSPYIRPIYWYTPPSPHSLYSPHLVVRTTALFSPCTGTHSLAPLTRFSQLKFTAKQLNRLSIKCAKEEKAEKEKVKKAMEKDNHEGARIHAQNAIRNKSNAQNYLRLSSRVDAVSSRLESAIKMQKVTTPLPPPHTESHATHSSHGSAPSHRILRLRTLHNMSSLCVLPICLPLLSSLVLHDLVTS